MQRLFFSLIAMGWVTIVYAVQTAQSTSNIPESARVNANCNIVSDSITLPFGSYDPTAITIANNLDSVTTFSVRCTKGTSAIITLSEGLNASGHFRRMGNAIGNYLNYQLYTNSSRSAVWNSTNTMVYAAQNFTPRVFSIYGRVPGGQSNVSAGSYSDSVTITVAF